MKLDKRKLAHGILDFLVVGSIFFILYFTLWIGAIISGKC